MFFVGFGGECSSSKSDIDGGATDVASELKRRTWSVEYFITPNTLSGRRENERETLTGPCSAGLISSRRTEGTGWA